MDILIQVLQVVGLAVLAYILLGIVVVMLVFYMKPLARQEFMDSELRILFVPLKLLYVPLAVLLWINFYRYYRRH
ncbi:TMhelix containing protein [Vibrio phage 1.031.O._10N.261.46.F8]|nr:TMhelix containing protein [Vibrio phage 1.031.O._10N.261.46.F8]